ncbi:MAG: hypothetical protein ACKVQR_16210 [Aquabacterium sp.]
MPSVPLQGPVATAITPFRESSGICVPVHNVGVGERALSASLADPMSMASLRMLAASAHGMPLARLDDMQVLQSLTVGLLSGELVLDDSQAFIEKGGGGGGVGGPALMAAAIAASLAQGAVAAAAVLASSKGDG